VNVATLVDNPVVIPGRAQCEPGIQRIGAAAAGFQVRRQSGAPE
jgi:hypothetical protein